MRVATRGSTTSWTAWTTTMAPPLELGDFVLNEQAPGSRIRVQRPTGTAYQINDQGVVTSIPAFYD